MLTNKLKSDIREYSLSNKGVEICGLLISKDSDIIFYKCRNISYHKEENCILHPLDYIKASELGEIISHVHSQEERNPSFIDYLNSISHNIHCIVYSWKYDKFSIVDPKFKSYLNLDYEYQKNNCYELIRNYYKHELDINISRYKIYNENEYDKFGYILDRYKDEGFYKIDYFNKINKNDIILFNICNLPHFAVYIGNNFILHHPENEKSTISELTNGLKKRINIILRYNGVKNE